MKKRSQIIISAVLLIFPLFLGGIQEEKKSPLLDSWEQHLHKKMTSFFNLEWIPLGPVLNSARVEAVQVDTSRPGTMYAAFGSGNLWKTVNHGMTWHPIFENQPALGIGDIALAPSRPETIWLGSGESLKKARNFTMPGVGIFRSDDGGDTWAHKGLPDSYHIGEIAVHPRDPDTVLVAVQGHFWSTNANRGIYRTGDGGRTWEHVLYIDQKTGANDVVFARSDPDIAYASMWENNPGISGKNSGVYKSEDGGRSWRRLGGGLPESDKTGRIGVAVSWSNPDKAYALVDNLSRERNAAAELYKTEDGGRTWQRTHTEDLHIFSGIGWYFTDCYVNPRDDEEVYALGIRIAHSRDGGRTFELIGGNVFHFFPSPAETLHLDHCEMWIHPENPDHLVLGNDGGFYVSYDKGKTWMHYNNIPAGEFYDIAVDNQDPYYVYGGVQDDASVYGPAKEWNPNYPDVWKYIWIDAWSGGDGCFTMPDPVDPNTVYFSMQNGAVRRKNMSADRSVSIRPVLPEDHPGKLRYVFVSPYLISHHNHLTLYHAANYIFKSLNQGDDWELISPDLSQSSHEDKTSTAVSALAESPLQPGLIYAGTDQGAFWVTRNDGMTWTERSGGLPNHYVRSICPSRFSLSRVYAAVSGINKDDLGAYLFVSEDYGKNWKPIHSDLPDETSYVIIEDPVHENILYAGMYRGIYISTGRGESWSLLGPGLPAAAVSDLVIQEREMDLIAGTHGRGIYKMNIRPIQNAFGNGAPEKDLLFPPPAARLPWINDTHGDPRLSTVEKVPFTFYLTSPKQCTLQVLDEERNAVWSQSIEGQAGFNQIRWNLVTERIDSPRPYFIHYLQFIPPGEYKIRLTGEGLDLAEDLVVTRRESPPKYD